MEQQQSQSTQSTTPFYTVTSRKTVDQLLEFFGQLTNNPEQDIGAHRVQIKNMKETDKTFFLFSPTFGNFLTSNEEVMEKLKQEKVSVLRFLMRESKFPQESKQQTKDLYIKLPNDTEWQNCKEILEGLLSKMESFLDIKGKYTIQFFVKSRITGDMKDFCFINFTEEVDKDTISTIHVLLHDRPWVVKSKFKTIRCSWAEQKGAKFNRRENNYQSGYQNRRYPRNNDFYGGRQRNMQNPGRFHNPNYRRNAVTQRSNVGLQPVTLNIADLATYNNRSS